MSFSPQNNASSTLAAAIVSTGATTFTVATGEGSRFGSGSIPVWIDSEAMLMTSRSGDVLTVARGQEGTTAATHLIGATVSADVDKALLEGLRDDAVATAGAYTDSQIAGVSGSSAAAVDVAVSAGGTLSSSAFFKTHICSGGSYTLTLPTMTSNAGKWIEFVMAASLTGFVTLDGAGADTIDGLTVRKLRAGEVAKIFIGASEWNKRGGKSLPLSCGRYLTSGASITHIASATQTNIPFDGTGFNVGSMAGGTDGQIIVPRPGVYHWIISVPIASTLGSSINSLGMTFRNGVPIGSRDWCPWSGAWYPSIRHSGRADDWAVGDVFTFDAYHTSGVTEAIVPSTSYDDQGARMALWEIPTW